MHAGEDGKGWLVKNDSQNDCEIIKSANVLGRMPDYLRISKINRINHAKKASHTHAYIHVHTHIHTQSHAKARTKQVKFLENVKYLLINSHISSTILF